MKKLISILLVLILIFSAAACEDKREQPVPQTDIPEGCELYFNTAVRTTLDNSKSVEADIDSTPDCIYMNAKGTAGLAQLSYKDFKEGYTIQGVSGGASAETEYSYKLYWNEKDYDSYSVSLAKNKGTMPGLYGEGGGVLVIAVNGKNTFIKTNELTDACLAGFDCIVFTGYGQVTLNDGDGFFAVTTTEYDLPSLIINDEVTVVCDEITLENHKDGCPALMISESGCLKCKKLNVNGDVLIASSGSDIGRINGEVGTMVLRSGDFSFRDFGDKSSFENIIISGGKLGFDSAVLPDARYTLGAGNINVPEDAVLGNGSLTIYGGELDCGNLNFKNGSLSMSSGVINCSGEIKLDCGSAIFTGGSMLSVKGEDSIVVIGGDKNLSGADISVLETE